MKQIIKQIAFGAGIILLTACTEKVTSPQTVNEYPPIYPDYTEVTIPATIAPMNFSITDNAYEKADIIVKGTQGKELHINGETISFDENEWHQLVEQNKGDSLMFTVCLKKGGKWFQYRSFPMYISEYPIDYGVAYRLIAPGYEVYSKMGIYQRNLSNFEEKAVIENTLVPGMCVNCHAMNQTHTDKLSLHVRGTNGGTLLAQNGNMEMLDTKTDSTLSACVYPYWHPSGKYIAYSVNNTRQGFHAVKEKRIEVMDNASDIVIYHPETHRLLLQPVLQNPNAFETFPAFSPDGKTLYFCSAEAKPMPQEYKNIKYSLCRIAFNPETGHTEGGIDTLVSASQTGKSVSFPRPSYDGRYLMFTLSDYGNFSIWHKEADLYLYDLKAETYRPIQEVNSPDTESFHNWSSNSHWFVFSSRRDNGLYTYLYFASIDEEGNITKPFMLPQQKPLDYYTGLVYSYNVPDFINNPIQLNISELRDKINRSERIKLKAQ